MDDVQGIPPGVIVKDARDILPTNHVIRHSKTGSPALHSDLFRYALLGKTQKTWVDLDIIARSPLIFPTDYIFGYESANEVNGAVLRLPENSPALKELLQYKITSHGYPPYMKLSRKIKYFFKSLGSGLPIEKWPWGSIGPRALTFHLTKTDEIVHALPILAFYPVPFENAELFLIPGKITDADFNSETYAVHFWGNSIRKLIQQKYNGKIPAKSYLGQSIAITSEWANFEISTSLE
jgi:hypothetical protein